MLNKWLRPRAKLAVRAHVARWTVRIPSFIISQRPGIAKIFLPHVSASVRAVRRWGSKGWFLIPRKPGKVYNDASHSMETP
jgi:hypothetical protein